MIAFTRRKRATGRPAKRSPSPFSLSCRNESFVATDEPIIFKTRTALMRTGITCSPNGCTTQMTQIVFDVLSNM